MGRSSETTLRLLRLLYHLDPPFNGEMALQKRCNRLLREETSYSNGFRLYYESIASTKSVLRDIRIQVDRLL